MARLNMDILRISKLIKLITWTTALSNSNYESCHIGPPKMDGLWWRVLTNGKPLQYSFLENPMNSVKGQKDRILKDELPRSVGA